MTRRSLPHQIETVWSLDPSAQALEFEGRWFNWGELRDAARAIDSALTAAGIGEGAAVGVMLRNHPGMVAALLGLLVSNRAIVSLSPFQPVEKLHEDFRKLQLPVVIAAGQDWAGARTAALAQELGTLGLSIARGEIAPIVQTSAYRADLPHQEPLAGTALEILTSGTTGTPKRIRISYKTMQDAIVDGATSSGKGEQAELAIKTTPSVNFAPLMHVSGMFGTLLSVFEARPVVLMEKFAIDAWADTVAAHKIRFTSLPPTPMRMVLDADVPKEKLASLIAVRAGTAPLPPETQKEFQTRYDIPVLVQYGATEWMGGIAGWTLDDHKKFGASKLGSVGRPRGGVKLRITDVDSGAEVPAGQPGILEVLPTQRLDASEWMRTTDLASLDEDGFLYIHGRVDDTIIRGGFKVQLNYVADVLMRHPAVLEASVIGLPDARLGQVPVAAIEMRPAAAAPNEAELKAFAQQHLTPYQVPLKFKVVDALPRTISMKVSRPGVKALFDA